ncbi:hypothetical protein CCMA1212_006413 [Trichoderma ghanense]|uniref:Cyanovirin-N domain-containing protein n=1 Tax=Trichoderma ghanense TaxID=65468 RepID=A0ABY2H0E6_9HYPO
MAFYSTSKNVSINGNLLTAQCRDYDHKWVSSSIDLDEHVGNSDGSFSLYEKNFSHNADQIQLQGATLTAKLRQRDGKLVTASLNLNLCIANVNGRLRFQKLSESVLTKGSCYSLERSTLYGLCLGLDGKFHKRDIDLNEYYENVNGDFATGRHFYYSARNVRIEPSNDSLLLKADLKCDHWYSSNNWNADEIDLSTCILIRDGHFVFEKHDGLFDRDGAVTKFFERVPFLGFVVAGIHIWAGNEEYGKRACAICANSSIVCCGIVVGCYFGGPLGGAIGAGITTWLAIVVEAQISGTIQDPHLQAQFEEATIGRYLYETLRNALAAGAAGYLAEFLKVLSEVVAYWLLKKVADALTKGRLPHEWIETERKFAELKAKRSTGRGGRH